MQDCLWGHTKVENRKVRRVAASRARSAETALLRSMRHALKPAAAPLTQVPVNVCANAATTQRRRQLEAEAAASPYCTVEKASL